ncbi:uncharacterized protein LOC118394567 [Oncorhynchus keta]|uniref:uncharacterized protein LOC118394567 n=1 Tax=Oncorhynchus keta TaxID=8018 RepID=UPI00227A04CC|nr:uncharacterized protein LOC118394567 [Oncorhynchus keta]
MRSVLLMLMLSITHTQVLSSCPASCVVCSKDTVICYKLSNILEAPETTKALMLTDGTIVSVDRHFLSDMSSMTVLSLSHNAITTITHDAFQNLTVLHTLLLDHNHLSSQALGKDTFSWLPRLEILKLGNNALGDVNGSWFHATGALRTLQLEGNRLSRLDATTFALADLQGLETLDLSDNLITYLGKDSFQGLLGLRSLDLSRNQLRSAPPEVFSYLSWMSSLNLELNWWNCTCELRKLASFLTSYMEAPDKVLFNGRRMVCVSADNPAVKTVLELTEAICVPTNQNITVQVEAKNAISSQRYTRDLALAAAFCFAGGVGLTLAVVYIVYCKLGMNKSLKVWRDRTGAEEDENGRTAPTQTVTQWDLSRENEALRMAQMGLETKLIIPNSHLQPWDRERAMFDLRIGKDGGHFTCPHCGPAVSGSAMEQGVGEGHLGAALHMVKQGGQPNKMESLAITEESDERKRHVPQQALISKTEDLSGQRSLVGPPQGQSNHILSQEELLYHQQSLNIKSHDGSNGNNQLLGGRSYYSPAHGNMPTHKSLKDEMVRPGNHIGLDNRLSKMDFQSEHGRTVPDCQYQTVSCVNCYRTYEYGQPGEKVRDVLYDISARESAGYDGSPNHNPLTRLNTRRSMNCNQSNMDIYAKHASKQRSVTFDLERSGVHVVDVQRMNHDREDKHDRIKSSRKVENGDKQILSYESIGRSVRSNGLKREDLSKRHKRKAQSDGLLKVKLNLNPLKKSKVHPRKNSRKRLEQGDRERTDSKNRKQLQMTGKDAKGKRHNQEESKEKTDKSNKVNSLHKNKDNQSSKNKSTTSKSKETDDNEDQEEEDPVPQENNASSKQKKTNSKSKHQEDSNSDHSKKSRADPDQKTDVTQNKTGGETEVSGGAPIPSNVSSYQSYINGAGGSSVNGQQVEEYRNGQDQASIPEVPQHPGYLGDGVSLQRTLSSPQLSAAKPLKGMERTSSDSNLAVQGGNSILLQNTVAPNTIYGGNSQAQSLSRQGSLGPPSLLTNIPPTSPLYTDNARSSPVNPLIQLLSQSVRGNSNQGAMIGSQPAQFPVPQRVRDLTLLDQGPGSLNGQNISQLAQDPGSLNGQNISQLAQDPGSLNGQNISQLAQDPGSLNGQNMSQLAQGPGSLNGQNIAQLAQDPGSLNGQNISQLAQDPGSLNGQNMSQLAQGPGSLNGQNISQLAQDPGSLNGQNMSQLAQDPGSLNGQNISQLAQDPGSLNWQNMSQLAQDPGSLNGQNISQLAQDPGSLNGQNMSQLAQDPGSLNGQNISQLAQDPGSLNGQNMSQLAQDPGSLNGQNISLLAQDPGSLNWQNMSQLAQDPGSLNGQNMSQLAQGPGSLNGQNIAQLAQDPGSLNGQNISQLAQDPGSLNGQNISQLAQGPGSLNGQNISQLDQGSSSGPGSLNVESLSNNNSMNPAVAPVLQEYLSSAEGSPRRIRLVLPERTTNRSPTALERKIR